MNKIHILNRIRKYKIVGIVKCVAFAVPYVFQANSAQRRICYILMQNNVQRKQREWDASGCEIMMSLPFLRGRGKAADGKCEKK